MAVAIKILRYDGAIAMIDAPRVKACMKAVGSALAHETNAYLLGGASAVLMGWREWTPSFDVTVIPEREIVAAQTGADVGVERDGEGSDGRALRGPVVDRRRGGDRAEHHAAF